jgi:hypothetical protein
VKTLNYFSLPLRMAFQKMWRLKFFLFLQIAAPLQFKEKLQLFVSLMHKLSELLFVSFFLYQMIFQ